MAIFETRALPTLIEERNKLLDELEELIKPSETRALTSEEQERYTEIVGKIEAIDNTLSAQETARRMEKRAERAGAGEEETRALEEKRFLDFVRGDTRALNIANNGAVIPSIIADRIIEKVKELSPIYRMATIYNVGGNLVFPVYDESTDAGAALVEDMTELTESTGKFTSITLENYIVGVLKLVSKSLLNRTDFDLLSFIVNKVAENLVEFLENGCLNGATGKYQGVFNTENLVTAASDTAITADELIDVQMTVPQVYQQNACWIMHKDTLKGLRKLKDGEGNYLLNRDIANGFGWTLLGKPVYISENAPKAASETVSIVYGDMSGLYVKLAQNIEIQVLLEKYATQHAIGVCGYVEFDSKIVEAQKLAGLKMKKTGTGG